MPRLDESLLWMKQGTRLFARALDARDDDRLAGPSQLPGWTGKHVVAHVISDARSLLNLTHWAATGEEIPQYASPDQRNAEIDAGAASDVAALRRAYAETAEQLADAVASLSGEQWEVRVRTHRGEEIAAAEIPWMRAREVIVHAVDLGDDVGFDDLGSEFLGALVDDVVNHRTGYAGPTLELLSQDTGEGWRLQGSEGEPVRILAPLTDLAAWLTGRSGRTLKVLGRGPLPDLPPWL